MSVRLGKLMRKKMPKVTVAEMRSLFFSCTSKSGGRQSMVSMISLFHKLQTPSHSQLCQLWGMVLSSGSKMVAKSAAVRSMFQAAQWGDEEGPEALS